LYVADIFCRQLMIRIYIRTLENIGREIAEVQAKSTASRLLSYVTNPSMISDMKQRLDEAIRLVTVITAIKLSKFIGDSVLF
jgi:uncharacterized membrane protein